MKHSLASFSFVSVGMMLTACDTREDFYDEPTLLCFEATADGLVNITADLESPEMPGCTRFVDAQCFVKRSADGITITATGQTETKLRFRRECTVESPFASMSCGSLAFEPGVYRLAYGSPSRRSKGVLVVDENALAVACIDGRSDLAQVTLPAGVECVGRPLDPVRGCFGEPENVGTMSFDAHALPRDGPSTFEDPSGTCYRFDGFCLPESWDRVVRCSPAEICDEN